MCSPGRDAAVEKGNETSPALLLPFFLIVSLSKRSIELPGVPSGRTEKRRDEDWPLEHSDKEKGKQRNVKIGRVWRRDNVLSKRAIRYNIAILHKIAYSTQYLLVNFLLITLKKIINENHNYNW